MARHNKYVRQRELACSDVIGNIFESLQILGVDTTGYYPSDGQLPPKEVKILSKLAGHPGDRSLGQYLLGTFHREMLRLKLQSIDKALKSAGVSYRLLAKMFHVDGATVSKWFKIDDPTDPGDQIIGLQMFANRIGWEMPSSDTLKLRGCTKAINSIRNDILSLVPPKSLPNHTAPFSELLVHEFVCLVCLETRGIPEPGQVFPAGNEISCLADEMFPQIALDPSVLTPKFMQTLSERWTLWFRLVMLVVPPVLDLDVASVGPNRWKED